MSGGAGFGDRLRRACASPVWGGVAVFAVALVVRVAYLVQSASNPTFMHPIVDAASYSRLAEGLAAGRMNSELFWQPLFYPCFLALVYSAVPGAVWTVKVLQMILGAGTCVLTFLVARKAFSHREGLVAGLILALYGPVIFIETELVGEGWALFWLMLFVLLLLCVRRSGSPGLLLATGLCGFLAVLTRPPLLAVFLVGCGWLAVLLWREMSRWKAGARCLIVAAGFGVPALLVGLMCQDLTGEFRIMPYSGGINLYIGNNSKWQETVITRPGAQWERLADMPLQERITRPYDQSAYFRKLVTEYVRREPGLFLRGLVDKAVRFVNSRELPRNVDIYLYREWSSLLSVLVWKVRGFGFPFGVLLPLSLLAVLVMPRRIPFALWSVLIAYPAVVILYFVAGRYRLLAAPIMAVLAAGSLVWLFGAATERRWRALLPAGVLLAGIGVLSAFPRQFAEEESSIYYKAEMYRCVGRALYDEGKNEDALVHFQMALAADPDFVEALSEAGLALGKLGRIEEALRHARKALALMPDDAGFSLNIGLLHIRKSDYPEAEKCFRKAIELDSKHFFAHFNLGLVLCSQGKYDEAVRVLSVARRLRPDDPMAASLFERARRR